jgi:hypothetical protein
MHQLTDLAFEKLRKSAAIGVQECNRRTANIYENEEVNIHAVSQLVVEGVVSAVLEHATCSLLLCILNAAQTYSHL